MHYEYIYIDAPGSPRQVADVVAAALRRTFEPQGDEYVTRLGADATVWLRRGRFTAEDDSRFPYAVLVRDLGGDPADTTSDVQEATARRVYEALAAATPWRLMLAYDDGDVIAATRPAATSAA